jgi:hypothetical protein
LSQRFNTLELEKENELVAFGERVKAATVSLQALRDSANDTLIEAQQRNEQARDPITRVSHPNLADLQLERLAEWFESSNELEAPAGVVVPPAAHAVSRASPKAIPPSQSPAISSVSPATRSSKSSPAPSHSPATATSAAHTRLSPMPTPSPRHAAAVAASPTVFSPSRNHIRRSLGEGSGAGAVVLCTEVRLLMRSHRVTRDARVQLQGSPLPAVLKQDGAMTSQADGDWISAEDVSVTVAATAAAACDTYRRSGRRRCQTPQTKSRRKTTYDDSTT